MAIADIRHRGLKELFERGKTAKVGKAFHKTARQILDHLDAITDLKDCNGVRGFHELKGQRKGTYAMTVSGNLRITFRWENPNVVDVNLQDYH